MNLDEVAPILEDIIKKSLEQKRYPFGYAGNTGLSNKIASGKLRDSVEVNVVKQNDDTIIQVLMEEYGQWVQSGRAKGKKGVPVSALEKWIKDRGLKGRNKKGRYITNKSFAFAIRNNITKFGIRPSNFIDYSLEALISNDKIIDIIGEGAYNELIDLIEGI
jgi:hypothetical protein